MTTITTTTGPTTTQPIEVMAGPQQTAAITPTDILKILRRKIVWILAIWIFAAGVTIGGTFFWARYYPSYSATAHILVESPNPGGPFDLGAMPVNQDMIDRFVRDQSVLIKSEQILREALSDPLLRETAWFQSFDTPDDALLELMDKLGAGPIRGSSYLRVSFGTHLSGDCYKIVNAVVDQYYGEIQRQSATQYRDQIKRFAGERDKVKRDLVGKIGEIRDFQKAAGIPGMTDRITAVGQRLYHLTTAVVTAQEDKLDAKAIFESYAASGAQVSPDIIAMVEMNPSIAGMQHRQLALREELGVQLVKLGEKHRVIRDLKSRMALIGEDLERLRQQKLQDFHLQRLEEAHLIFAATMEKEVRLRDELIEAEARQRELDEKLSQYGALKEEQRVLEEEFGRVQQHLRDLQIIVSTQQGPRITIAARAVEPLERSKPSWKFNLAAGIPLGLLLGVGVAFLLEFLDTSVRTPRDIIRHTALPLLGVVPILDDEEVAIDDIELATRTAPNSMVAEFFRQIRTALLATPPENYRTLLITSPGPEDGKTAIAINLAVTLAQSGRKVLLVDGNLRRPALHRAFPSNMHTGLSNILIGQHRLQELARPTELPQLDVVTAGPMPPNPVELLHSRFMRELITQARELYEHVIFDAPPCLLVSDPLVLANVVDGTIIVCRAGVSSRGAVLRTRDQLEQVDANLLGVILNGMETTPGGYYRQQYRSFYDYLSEADEQAPQPPVLNQPVKSDASEPGTSDSDEDVST